MPTICSYVSFPSATNCDEWRRCYLLLTTRRSSYIFLDGLFFGTLEASFIDLVSLPMI
jgi:hypothetical protein